MSNFNFLYRKAARNHKKTVNSKPKDPCSVVSAKNESHSRNVTHQNHSSEQARKYKIVRYGVFYLKKKKPTKCKSLLLFLDKKLSFIRSALSIPENIRSESQQCVKFVLGKELFLDKSGSN